MAGLVVLCVGVRRRGEVVYGGCRVEEVREVLFEKKFFEGGGLKFMFGNVMFFFTLC